MSKEIELAQRIRALKIGKSFIVKTEAERQAASKAAQTLKRAGVIDFRVVTVAEDGGFKIAAI